MITVLFTSAGRRAELINCFRDDAAVLKAALRVIAADLNPELSSACHLADERIQVPPCTEAGYVPRLLEICRKEKVKLLTPTIDTELEPLAMAAEQFEAIGTRVHISSLK